MKKRIAIKEHYWRCKATEAKARAVSMSNDHIETLINLHKQLSTDIALKLAENLCEEDGVKGNENIERARHSIELFGELMRQGVEVYSAINAPKEQKELFPPAEKQALPNKEIELLQNREQEENS